MRPQLRVKRAWKDELGYFIELTPHREDDIIDRGTVLTLKVDFGTFNDCNIGDIWVLAKQKGA